MQTFWGSQGLRQAVISDRGWNTLLSAASGLALAAAVIHTGAMPEHFAEWWGYGSYFLVIAVAQALFSAALLRWPRPQLFVLGIAGTLGVIGIYLVTRTIGVPFFGPHAGHVEGVGVMDVLAKVLESGLILMLMGLVWGYQARGVRSGARAHASAAPHGDARRHPLALLAAGTVALAALLVGGYQASAALGLGEETGVITSSDAEDCIRQNCSVHFTATMLTQQAAERMGLWQDVAPRMKTAQAFVIGANTHAGSIESLALDGKLFLRVSETTYPAVGQPLQVSTHHNSYLVFFPRYDMYGHALFGPQGDQAATHQHGPEVSHGEAQGRDGVGPAQFDIIIKEVGDGLPQHTLPFRATAPISGLTWATMLGLLGGFLASMWPCLFQLTAYFIPSLAGMSMQQAHDPAAVAALRGRVIRTALYFGLGIVIVYTAAGALAGYAAQSLQGTPIFETLRRPLAIGAGLFVIAMALRVAARARVPLVCKMPVLSVRTDRPMTPLTTMFTGVAFATGCMSCFGAVMALGMLTYSASTGSPAAGALILFVFSLGISIPLVAAAAAMARVLPLLGRLERWSPALGVASSLVMVGFGLLLLTDNYHVVSNLVARVFGVGYLL
ncbi:MAG: sulfite exporter TauE/SafE family protein [Chloroflexi bacterium]|nr:sulfite exporter TauE/SafE family protein [Chloroflexota bacterium]